MNTEEDRSKYRIHKAVVESYNSRPYEFTVLKDLIGDGTIEIYDYPENTTEYTLQIEEERVLQNLFEEYKSEYIICRREVEQNHATVMDELKRWTSGTFRHFKTWIGYKDNKKELIM
ncbi:Hypothetical predicted protein [Mytilus galloprovincialis]|uniref:Uncharacterized protein n=1 Tax=Mytilus galloprovincialis TaxID=29158 RepID=A0A8B6H301_MYTGA|nr:Hypothetical predicted protein [Mytilus galloprovincialis]